VTTKPITTFGHVPTCVPSMANTPEENPTRVPFEKWKGGSEEAFAELHVRFTPLLRARIRRHRAWSLLARHFELDDVLQDVWARAVPAAKATFKQAGPGSLLAFLGKIADREVIDIARRHRAQKRGRGGPESLATDFDAPDGVRPGRAGPTTPTSHARVAELKTLARAVLGEREHEAWDLVELRQFTPEEAGLAMRCSDSSVRGLLLRARAKLVARMTARGTNGSAPSVD